MVQPAPGRKKHLPRKVDFSKKYVCLDCCSQFPPQKVNRGWLWVEILLWLCYIVPGVIYSIWRRWKKLEVCRKCLQPSVVLTSSPQGTKIRMLIKTHSPDNENSGRK